MSEYETVNVHREGAAATIELNRPETLNAWNAQLGHDLLAAVTGVAEDAGVRAVVITGAGRAFSAGPDLRDLSGREERTPASVPDVRRGLDAPPRPGPTSRPCPAATTARPRASGTSARSWSSATARSSRRSGPCPSR